MLPVSHACGQQDSAVRQGEHRNLTGRGMGQMACTKAADSNSIHRTEIEVLSSHECGIIGAILWIDNY